jgi:hypothetical protein
MIGGGDMKNNKNIIIAVIVVAVILVVVGVLVMKKPSATSSSPASTTASTASYDKVTLPAEMKLTSHNGNQYDYSYTADMQTIDDKLQGALTSNGYTITNEVANGTVSVNLDAVNTATKQTVHAVLLDGSAKVTVGSSGK